MINKESVVVVMRLIIAGGREFDDYNLLCAQVYTFIHSTLVPVGEVIIISGCARGADSLGERYGESHGLTVEKYPAEWAKYGRLAGSFRNGQMARVATHCICFWDGESRGTRDMIEQANGRRLGLRIVYY